MPRSGRGPRLTRAARAAFAALALAAAACAPSGLEAEHPALRSISGQRLDDATPYVLAAQGSVVFFLCRWETGAPIPVSLPPDASADERAIVAQALRAWEGAGLGVRFVETDGPASLRIAFDDGAAPTAGGEGSGSTEADCRVRGDASRGDRLEAELVSASVRIGRRTPGDWRGHVRALSREELAGTTLHELGHALGLQGHPKVGGVMVRTLESVTAAGGRLLAGRGLDEPTLRALYALPSGTVLQRVTVSPARTEAADRLAALGAEKALAGPFVRVGDEAGRIFWVDEGPRELALEVPDLPALRRHPERLVLLPDALTRPFLAPPPVR